jgi:hypothetical protein
MCQIPVQGEFAIAGQAHKTFDAIPSLCDTQYKALTAINMVLKNH